MQPPVRIARRKSARTLKVTWADGREDELSWEFLRVHSPSAEVQGHGRPVVVPGKKQVGLDRIEPVGQYAVKLVFDDGHDTGLYTWELLERFGREGDDLWQHYLQALKDLGMSRESEVASLKSLHHRARE